MTCQCPLLTSASCLRQPTGDDGLCDDCRCRCIPLLTEMGVFAEEPADA